VSAFALLRDELPTGLLPGAALTLAQTAQSETTTRAAIIRFIVMCLRFINTTVLDEEWTDYRLLASLTRCIM
jgi:hypothetical protein